MMKRFAAALLLLCAPAAAHAADNFTFSGMTKGIDGVRAPAQGPQFLGAQVFSYSTDVVYANGQKETITGKCGGWKNPPGAQFDQSGVCNSPGNYTMQYSCQPETGKPGANCWGYLVGAPEGRYKGRTGLVTYRNADGGNVGVGRWND